MVALSMTFCGCGAQVIDYEHLTLWTTFPLRSLILRMRMSCSPLSFLFSLFSGSFPPSLPPPVKNGLHFHRQLSEHLAVAVSEEGRGREGQQAGQRLLVHTHIFSQMNLPLLLLLYRSLLPVCRFPLSRSSSELPNHIHGMDGLG